MIRPLLHLVIFFSLPVFVRTVTGAEPGPEPALVVVQSPEETSSMKLFEFSGGTPAEFLEQLKKTYGEFGMPAVTMEDKTGGLALPAVKVFANGASDAAQVALKERLQMEDINGWLKLKFLGAGGRFTAGPQAAGSATSPLEKVVLFQFPGGTPAELIAALDATFGCHLTEISTVAPEMSAVKLPQLRLKAANPLEVMEMLNTFSLNTAGSTGCWVCIRRSGESADSAATAEALMVTPRYDENNPSPAAVARDAAPGAAVRSTRELGKQIGYLQSSISQVNQNLEQVQEQVKKLETKTP